MKLKRLTESEFNRVVSMTNMTAATVNAARQVLVHGRAITTVAEENGVSKQWVFKAVSKIEAVYFSENGTGDALVSIELLLPEKIALQLHDISKLIEANGPQSMASSREMEILIKKWRFTLNMFEQIAALNALK